MVSPSYRILMIESDSSFAGTIRGMLEDRQNSNFQVAQAETLRAAGPLLAAESFDGVLLDSQALDSSGISGAVKMYPQISSLPIVVIISEHHNAVGKQPLDASAIEFLAKKTLSGELLQKTLRYAIERNRTERALRQSEQRFQDLFENAKDILFTLDLEGNVTSLNKSAEEVMGWTRAEALSINLKSLVAPEHANLCTQIMQRILNEEPLQHFEISLLRKDGRKALLETSARLIYSDGRRQGIQGIARDVTERRQLESMVRQSQKLEAIGRLSGGLAHDFNNLLCVISGHAELLSERLEETLPAARNVMQIKKAVDSASTLVRQLLAFSRKQVFH
jgi:two-component system cell cycle sensor histidine kinase/response regulator CckA